MKADKPTFSDKIRNDRINKFIGAADGIPQRKQIIDSATQQRYVHFSLEILENERNDVKSLAPRIGMKMNEFIIEAIREKMEKHSDKME